MIKIYTIGVYNSSESSFFHKLQVHNIELFCDIRQRRGIRGSQYKYVNSNYLQAKLQNLGIGYKYIKELAPTNEIRQKQQVADRANGETKKQRTVLGSLFRLEYLRLVLEPFDMKQLANDLLASGAKNIAFFCVEEHAAACHRSLVAQNLSAILDCAMIDI